VLKLSFTELNYLSNDTTHLGSKMKR